MKFPVIMKLKKPAVELDCFTALASGCVLGALCGGALVPPWMILLFLPFALLLRKFSAVTFAAGTVIAFTSGVINLAEVNRRNDEYPSSAAVSGIAVIRDSRAKKVADIVLKSRVRAEFYGAGKSVSCPVLLTLPEDVVKSGSLYGERFQVKGVLSVPGAGGFYFDGKKIGDELPPPYGKAYLLEAHSAEVLPAEKSFKRGCFVMREILLARLVCRMDDEFKSMAARLFLGASDGAPAGVKRNFVLAGIIHLFAVSGMHVAVLAGVAGILFIFLPFKWRYLLLSGITALYVMASGMAVPALRAGAMIIAWSVLRAFLYRTPNWNILMLSMVLFCIVEPGSITDLGAQYSYGITAALILGLSALQKFYRDGVTPDEFMVNSTLSRRYRNRRKWMNKFILFIAVALLAFTAGSMLTMLHQKYFLPGSILTNLAAALVTPFMFAAFIFKLLLGMFGYIPDGIGSWLIECGFSYLRHISEISLELFPPAASGMPGVAAAVLFYILFFSGLKWKNFYASLCAIVAALILLFSFPLLNKCKGESLLILSGSSAHSPMIAFLIPQENRAVVCNIPDSWSGALGADELLRQGCVSAEIFFSGGRSANNAGIKTFSSRVNVNRVNLPQGKPTVWFKRNFENISTELPIPDTVYDRDRQVVPAGDNGFYWSFSRGHRVAVFKCDSGWKIVWKKPDGAVAETVIPFANCVLVCNV